MKERLACWLAGWQRLAGEEGLTSRELGREGHKTREEGRDKGHRMQHAGLPGFKSILPIFVALFVVFLHCCCGNVTDAGEIGTH